MIEIRNINTTRETVFSELGVDPDAEILRVMAGRGAAHSELPLTAF
jgi:hypothetical protein